MRRGVIGGGNFIVDYVKTVDAYPAEQTLANIKREITGTGGAPYNVLRNLATLGADFPLEAVGRIGDDDAGRFIRDDLQIAGIGTTQLKTTPGVPTSYTLVMVAEGTGRRTFFHQRGANAHLAPEDFEGLRGRSIGVPPMTGLASGSDPDIGETPMLPPSHLHFGYLLLLDRMDEPDPVDGTRAAGVLRRAKEAGLTVSIDLVSEDSDRFRQIVPPALEHADLAFMNEFEASRLSGVDLVEGGIFQADRVGKAHAAIRPNGAMIVHWAEGAAACLPDGTIHWQGSVNMSTEQIASLTGTGDAFAAGYLMAFLRSEPIQDCLRLAVSAAAACITGLGCTDGMMREANCRQLGDQYGFRNCPEH